MTPLLSSTLISLKPSSLISFLTLLYFLLFPMCSSQTSITRFDLCNGIEYDSTSFQITSPLHTSTTNQIVFYICAYDQNKNPKSFTGDYNNIISIDYPSHILPDEPIQIEPYDKLNKVFIISVPISSHGSYTIFCDKFFKHNFRYYTISQVIDNENSLLFIENHIKQTEQNSKVTLLMKLIDHFGDEINSDSLINKFKCNFDQSQILHTTSNIERTYNISASYSVLTNGFMSLNYVPNEKGKYVFVPKLTCSNINNNRVIVLTCNECTFYVRSNDIDPNVIKLHSDFTEQSYLNTELKDNNMLYISLDESENSKLTTISFVDSSGMDTQLNEIDIINDKVNATLIDNDDNTIQINLQTVLTDVGFIDLYLSDRMSRSGTFLPLKLYLLNINIESTSFKQQFLNIPIMFISRNNYYNNLDTSLTTSNEFVIANLLPSKTLHADNIVPLCQIFSTNTNNKGSISLVNNSLLTCSHIELTTTINAEQTIVAYECTEFYLHLHISLSIQTEGDYSVNILYKSDNVNERIDLGKIEFNVVAQLNIENIEVVQIYPSVQQGDPSLSTITLNPNDNEHLITGVIKMKDKYDNTIKGENALTVYNSIEITENGITNELGLDGFIYIKGSYTKGMQRIIFKFKDKHKTIQCERTYYKLDPSLSNAKVVYDNINEIKVGQQIQIALRLRDTTGKAILFTESQYTSQIQQHINIYAVHSNYNTHSSPYHSFTYKSIEMADNNEINILYVQTLTTTGEYTVNVFYDNKRIQCYGSAITVLPSTADDSYTEMYYLYNNMKLKVPNEIFTKTANSDDNDNNNNAGIPYRQIAFKSTPFVVVIEHKDMYGNVITSLSTTYSLKLTSLSKDKKSISLCAMSPLEGFKYIYQVCGGSIIPDTYEDGEYYIVVKSKRFYFYVTSTELAYNTGNTHSTPSDKSMLVIESSSNYIYAKNDIPTQIVIDVRNENNLRLSSFDLTKMKVYLNNTNANAAIAYGPSKGFVTVFIQYQHIGEYNFEIRYNDNTIISNYVYVNKPGMPVSINELQVSTTYASMKANYISFELKDALGNACDNGYNELVNMIEFLIQKDNTYIAYEKQYNEMKGVLTLKIESFISGSISIESSYFNYNGSVVIQQMSSDIDNLKMYLNNISTNDDNDTHNIHGYVVIYDKMYNEIQINAEWVDLKDFTIKAFKIAHEHADKIHEITENDITCVFDVQNNGIHVDINTTQYGDIQLVPYYRNMKYHCDNCLITISHKKGIMNVKGDVYIKNGPYNWIYSPLLVYTVIQKEMLPLFKVILHDDHDNTIYNKQTLEQYEFAFVSSKGVSLDIAQVVTDNEIYLHLTQRGKDEYLMLSNINVFMLNITNKNSSETVTLAKFVFFNSHNELIPLTQCNEDAKPVVLLNNDVHSHKAGSAFIIEFKLEGCESQVKNYLYEGFILHSQDNEHEFTLKQFIPSDIRGYYMLLLQSDKTFMNSEFTIQYNNSELSDNVVISVTPCYSIGSVKYATNDNEVFFVNNAYAYFEFVLKDIYGNVISNEDRNAFVNDINVDVMFDNKMQLPIKLSYNTSHTFIGQIPLKHSGVITITIHNTSLNLKIEDDMSFMHSYIHLQQQSNNIFTSTVNLKDSMYQEHKGDSPSLNEMVFKYTSYDIVTNEIFNWDIVNAVTNDNGDVVFELPNGVDKAQFYTITPQYKNNNAICKGCFIVNRSTPSKYYRVINSEHYLSTNINTITSIEHYIEYPVVLYYSLTGKQLHLNNNAISTVLTSNTYIIAAYDKASQLTAVNEQTSLTLSPENDVNINLRLNSDDNTLSNAINIDNTEIISNTIKRYIVGEVQSIYIDLRDNNHILTSSPATISLTNYSDNIIEIPTSLRGRYLLLFYNKQLTPSSTSVSVTVSNKATPIALSVFAKANTPSSLSITSIETNQNEININISCADINNNFICDERINPYFDFNKSAIDYTIYPSHSNTNCVIKLPQHKGDVTLTVPTFDKDISQHISTYNVLSNINVFVYEINMLPRVIVDDDTNIHLHVYQKQHTNVEYVNINEIALYVYTHISFTKRILLSTTYITYNNNNNTFITTPTNINITTQIKPSHYTLTSFINGISLQHSIPFSYQHSYDLTAAKFKPTLITNSIHTDMTSHIVTSLSSINTLNAIDLEYPYTIHLQITNAVGVCVPYAADIHPKAYLLSKSSNEETSYEYDVHRISEYTYAIHFYNENYQHYLHLSKGDYVLCIKYSSINNYIKVNFNDGLFQYTLIPNTYQHITDAFPSSNFDVVSENKNLHIVTHETSFVHTMLCIVNPLNDNKVYNNYLNISNISFDSNSIASSSYCTYQLTITHRGCFDMYIKCNRNNNNNGVYRSKVYYNSIASTSDIVIQVNPTCPPIANVVKEFPTHINTNDDAETTFELVNKDGDVFSYIDYDNFKIYVDYKLLDNHSDVNIVVISNKFSIIIYNKVFTYPPHEHHVEVYFTYGNNEEVKLDLTKDITVQQEMYTNVMMYVPVGYKAGAELYMYLLLKDNNGFCYDDNNITSLLSNVSISVVNNNAPSSKYEHFTLELIEVDNVYKCKRVIKATPQSFNAFTTVGTYTVTTSIDSTIATTSTLSIYPNDLSQYHSTLQAVGSEITSTVSIKADIPLEIKLTGTDQYSNTIDFFNLAERFSFTILPTIPESNYTTSITPSETSSSLLLTLTVKLIGTYTLVLSIDGNKFNCAYGLNTVIVGPGGCSVLNPNYVINPMGDNAVYPGESVEVQIRCHDKIGNEINTKGDEEFVITVNGTELSDVIDDYIETTPMFVNENNKGVYKARFTLVHKGKYVVNIKLNGEMYGKGSVNVMNAVCNEGTFMCKDKSCVNDANDCDVSYVEGKCSGNDKEVFECKVNGEVKCVRATELSTCDCDEGYEKCNGMCLPSEYNYCNKNMMYVNCSEYGLVTCKDGSCRYNASMCADNQMTCPLGYVPCGVTCIQYGTKCKLMDTLNNDNDDDNAYVYCWDLSKVTTYDKCPTRKTCSNENEYLCPNGKCVENEYECMQPPQCENGYVLCDDMITCKPTINDCPSKPVCAQGFALCTNNECKVDCSEETTCTGGKVMCANGECVSNLQMCSSEMYCPEHYVRCSQGGCAVNAEQCKYIQGNNVITCPLDKPVLCPDLSCVSNSDMCVITNTTLCPPYAPYQCWNNECRTSFDLCPTKTTCPSLFPVLCVNGFCVKGPHHCVSNDVSLPTTANEVRCGDGTYASSILLCPTHVTCPSGKVRCWNSACVDSVNECRAPDDATLQQCTQDKPYRCFDGSCAETKQHCPLISTCPIERPVKCYDGSCRYAFNECPNYHSCGMNMVNCPGGMCAKSYDKCPSLPICSSSLTPYACYDNRCVSDIRDCYDPPECEGKILCPNGLCVTNRQNCKPSSSSLVRCWNGEWKVSLAYCEPFTCPINFPHKCIEGTCVTDPKYCDNVETSCPYNKPYKCSDGNCVETELKCISAPSEKDICADDEHLCPDGSCQKNKDQCPLVNGCQPDKPLRCADGTCINPKKTECTPPLCEATMPIRCANGQCATSVAECSLATKVNERSGCSNGMFMCADGRCVVSSEMCRALYVCGSNYVKCGDGSCRVTNELCPEKAKLCPKEMCGNGECVDSADMCGRKCPKGYSKCQTTGMCVKSENMGVSCPNEPQYKSGCDDNNKVKCIHDGRCMSDYNKCISVNSACNEDTPYLCADGKCVVDKSQCSYNTQCGFEEMRCPINGECVAVGNEHMCTNDIGCPIHMPIRCANGQCVKMYSECKATISCEGDKPYLCSDGSCVKDYRFCNVDYPCTEENMIKCNNGYCVSKAEQCDNENDLCPISSHIKCLNGKCVKHREECSESFSTEQCAEGTLFCTRLARCVRNVIECIGEDAVVGRNVNSKRYNRRFNRDNEDDIVVENACNEDTPYSCYDGTCVSDRAQCPILPACKPMQYRCPDGTCQYSLDKCTADPICEDPLHLCEDGLCRLHCPEYNGCSLYQFQCTNGMCVDNELECIGYSMCPDPTSPYRCIDNKCVSNPSTCTDIKRLHSIQTVTSSFTIHDTFSLSFSYDSSSKPIGSLSIPSNSIKHTNPSKTQGSIYITGIPHSSLYSPALYNNTVDFLHNVSNGIISSDGVLSFENAVLSPIVNIHSSNIESALNINALLHLEHNVYAYNNGEESFAPSDYCLSKLISNATNNYIEWKCVSRCVSYDQHQFAIDSLGIYAIVLNPLRNVSVVHDTDSKNFYLDNIKVLAIVLGVVILGSAVVFYVFSRIIRYREKYHESKKKEQLLIQQRQEYEMMSTDVFGQTLGDNILGLVYKQNCIFTLSQDEMEEKGNIGLENDVEELQRQCVNVERQNKRLEDMIAGINEDYKKLVFEINEMKG